MDKIELSKHKKQGDTFYTPFTSPSDLGAKLSLSSWARCWLPEFLWIGLIIRKQGRKKGFENMYHIIEALKDEDMVIPQLSKIFRLSAGQQRKYWSIVTRYVEKNILLPLTVVITPDINETFYDSFFDFSINVDENISELLNLAKETNRFHDELSTDICFIVDWFYIQNGRLYISNEIDIVPTALSEYYKCNHEDEAMRMYRPVIRSTFQGLCNLDCDKEFSEKIWKVLGKISECNPLVIVWDEEKEKMEFYEIAKQTIEYFSANNEDKKMETKYTVIMGMTCYIYRIYQEIIEKHLQNNISGRILFRTMLETYINLKYMMQQEDEVSDVYDRFKAYGNGKYKLVMAKLREEKYTVSDDSQIDERIMELMVNEDMDEAFVNISIGYFDKTSVRAKFKKCGEDELYEIYYEYATNFAHGIWGAIRESSMLICDNPAHIYHCVPDYQAEQNLRSVLSDCEMVMKKTFEAIADYIEFPEFYNI